MKVFTANLGTETNTFSPIPTGYESYAKTILVRGGDHGHRPFMFVVPLVIFRQRATEQGWSVTESLCARAWPSGPTARSVYEAFRGEILNDLKAAMPVDIYYRVKQEIKVEVMLQYGLTESGLAVSHRIGEKKDKPDSVGIPVNSIEAKGVND